MVVNPSLENPKSSYVSYCLLQIDSFYFVGREMQLARHTLNYHSAIS